MAGPDIVLFVIGALLFGGATYAIVSSPGGLGGAGSAAGFFNVQFQTDTVELDSQSAPSLRSASLEFEVTAMNVTALEFAVACTGQTGDVGPVTFSLAVDVQGPNGQTGSAQGSCGQGVTVPIEIAAAPGPATAAGATEADARANLATFENATAAQGTWTVTITGSRGGAPLPLPAGDPGGTVSLTATEWVPTLTPGSR
ncbi:MAG TPA: hypothetical protein VM370_07855 [Candidatus Thermoplasmatota archaeon]|nr:hypothetical protein [Candidatus Thermoplasmatota archaeon]